METVKLVLGVYGLVVGLLALIALAAVLAAGVVGMERNGGRIGHLKAKKGGKR